MTYKTFEDIVDGTPSKTVYKYSRKQLAKLIDTSANFKRDLLATKESKPTTDSLEEMEGKVVKIIKDWQKEHNICPECLGINGCMCVLKPQPKKIENIEWTDLLKDFTKDDVNENFEFISEKINKIIDHLNSMEENK